MIKEGHNTYFIRERACILKQNILLQGKKGNRGYNGFPYRNIHNIKTKHLIAGEERQ